MAVAIIVTVEIIGSHMSRNPIAKKPSITPTVTFQLLEPSQASAPAPNKKTGQGVANGNSDDIDGLIKFVRGYDYFGYKGCENMGEIRDSVLGDIYHSQIVEVGRPSANTLYTGMNQEAYFRSKNGIDWLWSWFELESFCWSA